MQLQWAGPQGFLQSQHVTSEILRKDEDICGGVAGRPHQGLVKRGSAALPSVVLHAWLYCCVMVLLDWSGACVLLVPGLHWQRQVGRDDMQAPQGG